MKTFGERYFSRELATCPWALLVRKRLPVHYASTAVGSFVRRACSATR